MNEEIREKDEKTNSSLKEKNDIIKKQSLAMSELMSRLGAISLPASADREEQRSTKDATQQDSDDGSVVLSALKRPSKRATSRENQADKRQRSVSKKMDAHSRPFSSDVWKILQEKGWKYKTGPEPYNKGKSRVVTSSRSSCYSEPDRIRLPNIQFMSPQMEPRMQVLFSAFISFMASK